MSQSEYAIDLARTANSPVTQGIHPFTIVSFEEGQKKGEDGTPEPGSFPYWRFTCACNTPSEEGKTIDLIMSLSPKARWRMEIFLDAVGAPESGTVTAEKFLQRKFRGKVTHEDYNGRPQARIGEMFKLSMAPKPAPAIVKPASVTKGKKKAEEPKGEDAVSTAVEEQDEIPFQ